MDQSKHPPRALRSPSPVPALLCVVLLAGCVQEELNPGLPGEDPPAGDTDAGPQAFPVSAGTELSYGLSRRYLKDHSALPPGGGSASVDETQSGGQLCLRVLSVSDGLQSNTASELTARVRVAGAAAGDDLAFGRVDASGDPDPGVTAAQVDAATEDLWLWQVTFPTRGHDLGSPKDVTFGTRGPITPTGSLATLLFFDPRASSDGLWAGWIDPGITAGADSMATQVQSYLMSVEGVDLFNAEQAKVSLTELRPGCRDHLTSSDCYDNNCWWEGVACRSPDATLSAVWRDNLSDGPAELNGDIIRSVSWEFGADGVLAAAQEYIIKDMTGTGPLSPFTTCAPNQPFDYSSGPCATATLLRRSLPFATTSCAFP